MDPNKFDDFTRSLVLSRRRAIRTVIAGLFSSMAAYSQAGAEDDEEPPLEEDNSSAAAELDVSEEESGPLQDDPDEESQDSFEFESTHESTNSYEPADQNEASEVTAGEEAAEPHAEVSDQEASMEDEIAQRRAEIQAEIEAREAELQASIAEAEAEIAEREAEAQAKIAERKAKQKAKQDFQRAGKQCDRGQPCGPMAPCANGICTPIACHIGNDIVPAGELNPDNECLFCEPSPSLWTDWTGIVADGAECMQHSDDPCLSIDGQCIAGTCVNEPFPDGSPCGPDNLCCAGTCCGDGLCCGANGQCITCEPQCLIDGVSYPAGTLNTPTGCLICDPNRSESAWSPIQDGSNCGGVAGRVCCNGECCSPTECCNGLACEECGPHCRIGGVEIPEGTASANDPCLICDPEQNLLDWSPARDDTECGFLQVCCSGVCCEPERCCREDGACGVCPCQIGNDIVEDGDSNPSNECQFCNSSANANDWTSRPGGFDCGPNGDRECCDGDCCPSGQCCTFDGCGECICEIAGFRYADEEANDDNRCEYCDVESNRFDWTVVDDGELCRGSLNSQCCGGNCCDPGQCCEGGTCQDCGCEIGPDTVGPDVANPLNSCQECDPTRNLRDWSSVDDRTPCGSGDQVCCDGECCPEGECCLLGACGSCLCQIDDTNYPDQTEHPSNPCQYCDQSQDPFGWSDRRNNTECGDDQVCCSGECCPEDQCCVLGTCTTCGCLIDDVEWADQQINPENSCLYCDPVLDPQGWSNNDDGMCGEDLDQWCCGGSCCPEGECCGLDATCVPCICLISGNEHPDGAPNPDNECQYCNRQLDPIGWSVVADDSLCGDGGDQVCCRGTCCAADECCVLGACAQCTCEIGDETYLASDRNPDNDCEVCDPNQNRFGWSVAADDTQCGESFDQVCCSGTCCETRQCCTLGVCGLCGCLIDDVEYDEFEIHPDNECFWCDPVLDQFAWTPRSDVSCGENDDQTCCAGECCEAHQCCDLSSQFCRPCKCFIDEVEYQEGDRNPDNDCEVCEPFTNHEGWTETDDHSACGPNGDQFCCNGSCCPEDLCCRATDQICGEGPCECQIGGTTVLEGANNPDNPCQFCSPRENETDWTPVGDFVRCEGPLEEFGRYCCSGICCPAEECCRSDGTCGECGCNIDGVDYTEGERNPENDCEICIPAENATGWSTLPDDSICGENADQVCCDGVCGACGPCTIDGVSYERHELNPANECEACIPAISESAWSPAPFLTKCGNNLDRICCEGVCCPEGDCCRPGFSFCSIEWCGIVDPCPYIDGPCGCTIDGTFYGHQTDNPATDCQWCDAYWSTTDWTSKPYYYRCGPNSDRFCCQDVCCDVGSCCNDSESDICEFEATPQCQGCIIGGRFFSNLQSNPDNRCEYCDRLQSTATWSNRSPAQICDTIFVPDFGIAGLYCCEGVCCSEPTDCCNVDGTCRHFLDEETTCQ